MAITETKSLESAYQASEALARSHYENFPVASRFLPKNIRRPIAVIYAFARQADDIADEGDFTESIRLEKLQNYWQALEKITQNVLPSESVFIALYDVLKKNPSLPTELLFDLLRAFKQDVVKKTYINFEEILNYCQYSANPIGRLLLHLTNNATPENLAYSDNICTALQLINFLQDVDSDLKLRNRCYLPQDELKLQTQAIVIQTQLLRIEQLLKKGAPLGKNLTGLFGFEIRLIINAANIILKNLKNRKSDDERSTLKIWHWPQILILSLKIR
jgi:squalene synthase HpnC